MNLNELRQALGRAVDELGTEAVIADAAKYEAKEKEIADLQGQIDRASKAQARAAALARPANAGPGDDKAPIIVPASLSLDMVAPRSARTNWTADDYLHGVRKAIEFTPDREKHFSCLGEQLQA